ESDLSYAFTSQTDIDQSRAVDQSTQYNFVDQSRTEAVHVNDNDIEFVENRNTTLAFPETRLVEVDNSHDYVSNVEHRFVDQDNSVVNLVDDRSLSLSTTQEPVYNFDNSTTIHLTQVIQAPERSGGTIFMGNA
ncbi:MAG: hypothetical protein KKC48_05545, partial [Proteobacteria bacterium]|nr:hypothetical protein [Pseudomonadota bacterium]